MTSRKTATHGEDICAAIESENGEPVVSREMLSGLLPKYMLPQHFLFLDKFPLNASGKTDLAALRACAIRQIQSQDAEA